MRSNTLLITATVLGLFVVSIVAGYIGGEKYFQPRPRPAPVVRATPLPGDLAPPTMPPGAPGAVTPRPAPQGPAPATPTPSPVPGPAAAESPGLSPVPRVTEPSPAVPRAEPAPTERLFIVQVGAFASRENADALAARLRADGFSPYVVRDGSLLKVRVGAFRDRTLADVLVERLRAKGYPVAVIH